MASCWCLLKKLILAKRIMGKAGKAHFLSGFHGFKLQVLVLLDKLWYLIQSGIRPRVVAEMSYKDEDKDQRQRYKYALLHLLLKVHKNQYLHAQDLQLSLGSCKVFCQIFKPLPPCVFSLHRDAGGFLFLGPGTASKSDPQETLQKSVEHWCFLIKDSCFLLQGLWYQAWAIMSLHKNTGI